jgi:hypothetical protein
MNFTLLAKSKFPACCTKEQYKLLRKELRQYGVENFYSEFEADGIFKDGLITSEIKPFNPFARIIAGKMENPCKETICHDNFVLLRNLPVNDDNWNNSSPEWVCRASMSQTHKFLSPIDPKWTLFNVLVLGIQSKTECKEALELIEKMEKIAKQYAQDKCFSPGLYFHCYPFNSVQTLHLHILDMDNLGPSFKALNYKNLSLDDVREVLQEELFN